MTLPYVNGRVKYARPQAILFANNPGTIVEDTDTESPTFGQSFYIPTGEEFTDFIILTDDNRGELNMKPTRIEKRERMVNGRMRSYHIADKLTISTQWSMVPSRSFATDPNFDPVGRTTLTAVEQYTSDGGAGGVEILDWYENHTGSFWVYLSYDKYSNFATDKYNNLNKYSQVVEVFFGDFDYNVVKRGGSNYDFWNVSLSLEEV